MPARPRLPLAHVSRPATDPRTSARLSRQRRRDTVPEVALRRELGPAPLRLTWVLPPGWLERWLEDAAVSRSPLSELRALALRGSLAEQLSLKALLAADNDAGAQRIEAFLRATEADVRPIADAMLGPGQSPRVHIERAGLRVQLTTAFDARALVSRWLDPSPR